MSWKADSGRRLRECCVWLTVAGAFLSCAVAGGTVEPIESPLYRFAETVARETAETDDPTRGNHVCIIDDGHDALVLRLHLFRAARRTIDIQTFILANDDSGGLLMAELLRAAERGVRVRMIVDHVMSTQDAEWAASLVTAHPNLELKYYRPTARAARPSRLAFAARALLFTRSINQRMHNKLILVDGLMALTGGRNMDNQYYSNSTSINFIDRDALVAGPCLAGLGESFEKYWEFRHAVSAEELRDVSRVIQRELHAPFDTVVMLGNDLFEGLLRDADNPDIIRRRFLEEMMPAEKLEVVVDPPGKNRAWGLLGFWGSGRITRRLRRIFRDTQEELVIQSPYLVVGFRTKRALRRMRRENPDARIIVSTNSFAATDNILAYSGNYKFRNQYIEWLGFEVYEMKSHPEDVLHALPNVEQLNLRAEERGEPRRPFLCIHAKSFVSDGRIAFIGSYNIDPRSENLNSEIGLLIEDEQVAARLRERILRWTEPGNSYVIAKRPMPLPLDEVNRLISGIIGLTPLDIWPFQNTTSYELKPGKEPVPTCHEDFHHNYRDMGSFPGSEGVSAKSIMTRAYKALGTLTAPML